MLKEATTKEELVEISTGSRKTVLYFSADWCNPCKGIKPVVERLSESHPDISFVRVDVDAGGDLQATHRVRTVPTAIVLEGDTIVGTVIGTKIATDLSPLL